MDSDGRFRPLDLTPTASLDGDSLAIEYPGIGADFLPPTELESPGTNGATLPMSIGNEWDNDARYVISDM
jgi:hypothetical protein